MATTIITKYGSGAPTADDVVRGELAVDTENGRLYTEDSGGSVIEIGLNPSGNVDVTGTVTADGLTVGDSSSSFTLATIQSSTSGESELRMGDTDTDAGSISYTNSDDTMTFRAAAAARMSLNSTGLDVTGTVTADGLTVDSSSGITVNGPTNQDGKLNLVAYAGVQDAEARIQAVRGNTSGTDSRLQFLTNNGTSLLTRVDIDDTGDISFYEDTGTTAKLFWDASAESLGIGTTSPAEVLHVTTSSGNSYLEVGRATQAQGEVGLKISGGTSGADWYLYQKPSADTLHFYKTGDRVTIDSSGNVGIGVSSPTGLLTLGTGTFSAAAANTSALYTSTTAGLVAVADGFLLVDRAGADVLKVDSSGNLLVGTATTTAGNEGMVYFNGSSLRVTRDSDEPLNLDRLTTDGSLVDFKKDGTTVGSIGALLGGLYIGSTAGTDAYIGFTNSIVYPSTSAGVGRDAAIDLGTSDHRFKDLYLSGRVIANGVTTSAHAWSSESDSTSSSAHLYFRNPNGFVGNISTSASATAYNTSSDYRLKENVVSMSGATERLKQLKPSRFNFIADADTTVDGFLAHEVAEVIPEAVTGAKDAVDDDGNAVYQGIDQSKLVPLLVATIQELEARIAALEGAN